MVKLHHGHPMEVHQLKEHKKKSWITYLFEFFMLFLAVFCGFLAEYQLEHIIERDREKEFIVSMVKEMQLDMIDIKRTENDTVRYKYLDTLALYIFMEDRSLKTMKKTYEIYFNYATYYHYYVYEEFTLSQLKFAGNMRLIRNKKVADRLIYLDGLLSNLHKQEMDYRDSAKKDRVSRPGAFRRFGDGRSPESGAHRTRNGRAHSRRRRPLPYLP